MSGGRTTSRRWETRCAYVCAAVFAVYLLFQGVNARADAPFLTGDLQLGVGLPVAGHLGPPSHYDDHARFGPSAFGDIGLSFNDRFVIEVVGGLGYLFELDAQNDDVGGVFAMATLGAKVRLLDSRRLWISMHGGYFHLDGHQGGVDVGLGYDLGLGESWDLGVFTRYALMPRGTATQERAQHFDALLTVGMGVRFGRVLPRTTAEEEPAPVAATEQVPVEPAEREPAPVEEEGPTPVEPPEPAPAEPPLDDEPQPRAPIADVEVAVPGTHVPFVVLFAYGDEEIHESGVAELRKLARWLRAHPEAERLRIVGHTDPRGDEAHNARLSVARARRVRDWLVQNGFRSARFDIIGVGATEPAVENPTNERDHRRNRRVELIVAE